MSRELGILFKPEMHLAIREDRKTQTRRIVKGVDFGELVDDRDGSWSVYVDGECHYEVQPRYRVGDRLYVKEGLRAVSNSDKEGGWIYRLDNAPVVVAEENWTASIVWAHHKSSEFCSPLHMPKWAARTWLEVTGVRAERLQDISEDDAIAEGVAPWPYGSSQRMTTGELGSEQSYRGGFACRWDEINEEYTWKSNPWVWVYEFRRIER